MNLIELNRALGQLRLGGIAAVLETRLRQAQAEAMPPIDFLSCLVSDELTRRGERLLERRKKQAEFRDPQKTLDNFDFNFNRKMNRSLVFDLATGAFIARHEDGLFLGPPGTGKSHLAQAIGQAAIQQGYRVLYRETHKLLDDLAEATIDGTRRECLEQFVSIPLLIIDDLGMRKLPMTAAEDMLEIVMRRYERASTLLTSNRPVDDWGKLLGDSAAVTAMLDRILHHGHVLKCGPRSSAPAGSSSTGYFARSPLDKQMERSSLLFGETTWMSNKEKESIQLLQGTLDLIVLRTLAAMGPQHAYQIATRLQQVSDRLLNLNQGTLYPALLRLEQYGWIKGTWGRTESNREAKYYEITKAGQKALGQETQTWRRMSALVERLLLEES